MKDLQFSPPTNSHAPFFRITASDLQGGRGVVKALHGPKLPATSVKSKSNYPPLTIKKTRRYIGKRVTTTTTTTTKREIREINGPLSRAETPLLCQINQDMFISCSGKRAYSITWMLMLQPCKEIFKHTAGIRLWVHRLPGPACAGAVHAELSASSKTIYLERASINTRHCPLVFTIHPLSLIQDKFEKAASTIEEVHTH